MRPMLSNSMRTSQEILVECWYDRTDRDSVIQWAETFVKSHDHVPTEVFEIFDAQEQHLEDILLRLTMTIDSDFSPQSLNAEILAAKYLIDSIKKYLSDEMTPIDICRVIRKIDCGFMNAPRDLPDNIAYYPCWLGNLYDSCDWCDSMWTADSVPHLKQDLKSQLPYIIEWIDRQSSTK